METMLIVVTIVALALAVGMAVLAWRLLRDDRRRAAARAESLLSMATSAEEVVAPAAPTDERLGVWPSTKAQATPSEVEGWDLGLGKEHESAARIASSLTSLAPSPKVHAPRAMPTVPRLTSAAPRPQPHFASFDSPEPMFGATDEHGAPARRWLVLAGVVTTLAAVVGTVYLLHRPARAATPDQIDAVNAAAPAPAGLSRPLELLSLRHSIDPDGAFTVTGLVQNPFDGRVVRRAVAVVYLFDREGNYFASGKATLDFTALQPGDETPFVVHVANVGHVSRYRVGFRSEEGGVIAHVDRRGQLPGGTTGDAIEPRPAVPTATRRSEG